MSVYAYICVHVCEIVTLGKCQLLKPRFLTQAPFPCCVDAAGFHSFSFYELKSITNDFDERPVSIGGNRMGEGGFGVVYKGCVNNTTVAVKKLGAVSRLPHPPERAAGHPHGTRCPGDDSLQVDPS